MHHDFPIEPPPLARLPMYEFPQLYEVSYDNVYPREIEFFDTIVCRHTGARGKLIELASGNGRVTLPLARLGYECTAVDLQKEMLDSLANKAAAEKLRIKTMQGDIRNLELEVTADAVICPVGVVAMIWQPHEAIGHFRRIARSLRPGGVLVYVLPAANDPPSILPQKAHWDAQRGAIRTRSYFSYDHENGQDEDVVRYRYQILADDGEQRRLLYDEGILRIYSDGFLRKICSDVAELNFIGWQPMFDPSVCWKVLPKDVVAAVAILQRK